MTTGAVGAAKRFDGVDDHVEVAFSDASGWNPVHDLFRPQGVHEDEFSLEVWVRFTAADLGGVRRTVFRNGWNGYWIALEPDGRPMGGVWTQLGPVANDQVTGSAALSANVWHQIVLVKDSGKLSLYADGSKRASVDSNGPVINNVFPTSPFGGVAIARNGDFGYGSSTEGSVYRGEIDEVVYFDHPLRALRVWEHASAQGLSPLPPKPAAESLNGDPGTAERVSDPVTVSTGNFGDTWSDLPATAGVFGLGWSRTYNSRRPAAGVLGVGWTTPFEQAAVLSSGSVKVTQADGREVWFDPDGSGGWKTRTAAFTAVLKTRGDGSYGLDWPDGSKTEFTLAGAVESWSAWDGQTVTVNRSGSTVTGLTSSVGPSLTFAYTSGRLSAVTASDGRAVGYGFDANQNLSSVTDAAAKVWALVADANGRLTKITDPQSVVIVENVYETMPGRRVTRQYGPGGATPTAPAVAVWADFTYNDALGVTVMTSSVDNSTIEFEWDLDWNVVALVDSSGARTQRAADGFGFVAGEKDPTGLNSSTTFDSGGRVLSSMDATQVKTTNTYDPQGRLGNTAVPGVGQSTYSYEGVERLPSTVTSPTGKVITFDVSASGLVNSKTDPDGVTTTYTYWPNRLLKTSTDELNRTTQFDYDTVGRLSKTTFPDGTYSESTYDGAGRVLTSRAVDGGVTTTTYDNAGRVTSVTDPLGKVTQNGYDPVTGRLVWSLEPGRPDPAGRTLYEYDGFGQLRFVKRPTATVGVYATSETRYDVNGRVERTIDPEGRETRFEYDLAGRQTKVFGPDGGVTETVYDSFGRAWKTIDPAGRTTETQWDAFGREYQTILADGQSTWQDYDAEGRVYLTTDQRGGQTTTAFTDAGRVLSVTNPDGSVTTNGYDAAGQLITQTQAGMAAPFDVRVTQDGAGLLWRFAETTGNALDSAGANPGTVSASGVTRTQTAAPTDVADASFGFDGAAGNVSGGDKFDQTGTAALTVAAYIRPTNVTGTRTVVDKSTASSRAGWSLELNGDRVRASRWVAGTAVTADTAAGAVAVNTWAHVAATYDGTTIRVYVNGVQQATAADARSIVNTTAALRVGANSAATGNWFAGQIDEVAVTPAAVPAARVACQHNPTGCSRTTTLRYDLNGRRDQTRTPAGRTSTETIAYNATGRLVTTTDPAGVATARQYNKRGELLTEQVTGQGTVTYTYNDDGTMATVTDAVGSVTSFGYDLRGNQTTRTNALSGVDQWAYNLADEQISHTDPANRTTTTTTAYPLAGGRTVTVADPSGRTRTDAYASTGDLVEQHAVLSGQPDAFIAYGYDPAGRRCWAIQSSASVPTDTCANAPAGSWAWSYDPAGQVAAMISPEGKLTSITRDIAGRPNALRYPDGQVLDVAYKTDPTKQIDTVTPRYTVADGFDGPTAAADSNKWTVTNTSGGSQAKNEFADTLRLRHTATAGSRTSITAKVLSTANVDVAGQVYWLDSGVGSELRVSGRSSGTGATLAEYRLALRSGDPVARLQKVVAGTTTDLATYTIPEGSPPQGWRLQINGSTIQAKVFAPGSEPVTPWQLSVTDSAVTAAGVVRVEWARVSGAQRDVLLQEIGIINLTAPPAVLAAYRFDDDGNPVRQTLPGGGLRRYTYGVSTGQLVGYTQSGTNANKTTTLGYDSSGRVRVETNGTARNWFGYDHTGQLCWQLDNTSATPPAGTCASPPTGAGSTAWTYDQLGRRASERIAASPAVTYRYDVASQLCWTSNAAGAPGASCAAPPAGATVFTYDPAGRQTGQATGANTLNTSYDNWGRIDSVARTTAGVTTTQARSYTPDNRLAGT